MGKALKFFVVLNLLVSAGVAYLGVDLYLERQVVKAPALLLEDTARTLSENLLWGADVAWETQEERKLTGFNIPQPVSADSLPDLDTELGQLVSFATQRTAQLRLNFDDLVQTRITLEKTRETLAMRERELADARQEIARLNQELEIARNDLREANRTIDTLESEKENLNRTINNLNDDRTVLNNQIASIEVDVETRLTQRDRAIRDYEICRTGGADEGGGPGGPRGETARILAVNPEWEYVVIDKGADLEIENFTEAFVHRGNKYVGKLEVIRVEENMAIAQIKPGSVAEGTAIKPGDTIFF